MKTILNVFKLRIGLVITFTALAAAVVTPGTPLPGWKMLMLALTVLVASASAGAFNQYVERDIDALMARTRKRPFVTGAAVHDARWVWLIMALTAGAVLAAGWALNPLTALYVFLGAFFYAIVYTVWLKRGTWMNIVIGGLSGSFAVLAGAAAVAPDRRADQRASNWHSRYGRARWLPGAGAAKSPRSSGSHLRGRRRPQLGRDGFA